MTATLSDPTALLGELFGKAAAAMAQAVEANWNGPLEGLVVTRYGHAAPCETIEVVEAAHPVPDEAGSAAAERMLNMVQGSPTKPAARPPSAC
jgi:glycerate-2-kinase